MRAYVWAIELLVHLTPMLTHAFANHEFVHSMPTAIQCPALATGEGNATWPAANAGTDEAAGVCWPGYTGHPARPCLLTGEWGDVINGCERTCMPCALFDPCLSVPVPQGACASIVVAILRDFQP